MAKLMAPNIRIDWYPEGHFADIQNPTVAELNSGYNLSCAIVTGYTLDFTDSNTEDTTTIFDDFTSESFLNHSYEADLQFFLAPRGSNVENEAAYRKAEELFYRAKNNTGYLAKRFGFMWDKEYSWEEPRQRVDLFKVKADLPKVISEDDGPILLNVRYIPQGEASSGATAGRIRYEWEGEPHNSPSVKILDDHIYTYEWEGEPHNSESIKYKDGKEVARNYVMNPSFETGVSGWQGANVRQNTVSPTWFADIGGPSGDYSALFTASEGQTNVQITTTLGHQIRGDFSGKYVGISALVASDRASVYPGIRNNVGLALRRGNSTARTVVSEDLYGSYYEGARHTMVTYVDLSGIDTLRPVINMKNADGLSVGDGARTWVESVIVVVAETEEEVLAQLDNYFDGDTPTQYGEILARNLFVNPSFENGTAGVSAGTSNTVINAVPKNGVFEWASGGGEYMLEVSPANDSTSSIYARPLASQSIPVTPGEYVAIRMDVATNDPEGIEVRATAQFDYSGVVPSPGFEMLAPEGETKIVSGQVPEGVSRIYLLPWARKLIGNFSLDDKLWVDRAMVAIADTEEEALAQVREYFDGDTVDK